MELYSLFLWGFLLNGHIRNVWWLSAVSYRLLAFGDQTIFYGGLI
ncbi:hypothetical protein CLV98_11818 [Dyadobacter jejuensis]|uniref:Uncharacterized protein n=1 Tax=Dyadobacter jejuensis TaxID=1082580 RepID=A0A316A8K7_9BACT|nr:hypothetical protein CLV98_11818 [Dyadobacter jejuensis]